MRRSGPVPDISWSRSRGSRERRALRAPHSWQPVGRAEQTARSPRPAVAVGHDHAVRAMPRAARRLRIHARRMRTRGRPRAPAGRLARRLRALRFDLEGDALTEPADTPQAAPNDSWRHASASYEEFVASAVRWNELAKKNAPGPKFAKSSLSWLRDR